MLQWHHTHATASGCRKLSPAALRYIAAHVQPHTVYPGHTLCHQGDEADCMWVLSDGEVVLYEVRPACCACNA